MLLWVLESMIYEISTLKRFFEFVISDFSTKMATRVRYIRSVAAVIAQHDVTSLIPEVPECTETGPEASVDILKIFLSYSTSPTGSFWSVNNKLAEKAHDHRAITA